MHGSSFGGDGDRRPSGPRRRLSAAHRLQASALDIPSTNRRKENLMSTITRPARLHHLALTVTDVERSVRWYEAVFGIHFKDRRPPRAESASSLPTTPGSS